jgi:hypothetical protein
MNAGDGRRAALLARIAAQREDLARAVAELREPPRWLGSVAALMLPLLTDSAGRALAAGVVSRVPLRAALKWALLGAAGFVAWRIARRVMVDSSVRVKRPDARDS